VKIEMEMYKDIRQSYINGESQRHIASRLGISRKTVKRYCNGDNYPSVRKNYDRKPEVITDEVKRFILDCFYEDKTEGVNKQKHTSKRIYDRLVDEIDFAGGESTVRRAVRELKAGLITSPVGLIPLSYDPGEAVQIDWGVCTVYVNEKKTKLHIFCGRLCYSCDIYVQAFKAANEESFLEAQQRMFDFFGGIPKRLIFDNAKVAVKEGFGLYAKPQKRYLSFSAHYAFDLDFCNPGKGNEKSLVENLVGYSRRNFLVPIPRVKSIDALNEDLWQNCLKYRSRHKIQGRSNPVSVMYSEEKQFLNDIPAYKFDTSRTVIAHVDDFSTIRFDKNNYSVPARYLRKDVTVKGYGNKIYIFCDNKTLVSYERHYGTRHTEYKLEHYIDLLKYKPRAVFNAKPVKDNVSKKLIDWGKKLPGGNKEMVKLLRLCVDHGEENILKIKDRLPSNVVPTVDMVRTQLSEPLSIPMIYLSNNIDVAVEDVDLKEYDKKYGMAVHR